MRTDLKIVECDAFWLSISPRIIIQRTAIISCRIEVELHKGKPTWYVYIGTNHREYRVPYTQASHILKIMKDRFQIVKANTRKQKTQKKRVLGNKKVITKKSTKANPQVNSPVEAKES